MPSVRIPRAFPRRAAAWVLDAVFPPVCPGCGVECPREHWICLDCRRRFRRVASGVCLTCRREGGGRREAGLGCSEPGHLTGGAAFWMEPPLDGVIHGLKYHDQPHLGRALGGLLAREVRVPPEALVTALPLHPVRLRERGYNQAGLLAEAAARRWGMPFLPGALARRRATRVQARLSTRRRAENVAGAFTCPEARLVRGRTWVLVDDVATTGSTVGEAAACLRAAGAERVVPVTLALA